MNWKEALGTHGGTCVIMAELHLRLIEDERHVKIHVSSCYSLPLSFSLFFFFLHGRSIAVFLNSPDPCWNPHYNITLHASSHSQYLFGAVSSSLFAHSCLLYIHILCNMSRFVHSSALSAISAISQLATSLHIIMTAAPGDLAVVASSSSAARAHRMVV